MFSRTHRYQICRIHTTIHKHDLLVIPVSSFFFAFLSAVASDVLGLLSVWETAAKGPLAFFFPQLSFSSSSSHCQQVSCYSLWTQQFSKQCKCSIHHWHFCGISAGSVRGGAGWLAVRKLTSVISSTHQRMLTPASPVKWAVLKRCQPHGVSLLF